MIFVGDDWAEAHHDICVLDEHGEMITRRRLPEGLAGMSEFHELLAAQVEAPEDVVIGIETERGLWVDSLIAAGYVVYAINPKSVAHYRERHSLSGAKSDAADAKVLADLVRTDRHNHRPVAGDSANAAGIKVLARTHQSLIWSRTRHTNQLRHGLRDYYPAALEAFDSLGHPDALGILDRAPTPDEGAKLSISQIRSTLKRSGRKRNIDERAAAIQNGLRTEQLEAPAAVVDAFAATTKAAVAIIAELNRQIAELEATLTDHFEQHPDAGIYLSLPGLGRILGARALGEFGDDPDRYATAKSRKNYAGTSPITIASGTKKTVIARYIRNKRLYDAIDVWAFASITASPGCRAYYDERRAAGDHHHQALRALGNRLVGILHGCLQHHAPYDEHTAWGHRQQATDQAAA